VFHRSEQQRDRIDERAIEIEENGEWAGFSHTAKVIARGAESEWGITTSTSYAAL
jgi:hypothetical protein